ncbi:MAG: serine hydrolase domain-containing protein [Actinomycetota bacterium]
MPRTLTGLALAVALVATACTGAGDNAEDGGDTGATTEQTASVAAEEETPLFDGDVTLGPMEDAALRAEIEALTIGDAGGLDAVMADIGVPGLAVAVIRDGGLVLLDGWGTDPADGAPIDGETVFQVGSVSKPVAALTLHAAGAAGEVDLDVPLADSTADPAVLDLLGTDAAAITPRLLLAHRGGVGPDGFLGYGATEQQPDTLGVLTGDGNSTAISVTAPPDTAFSYSGGGYMLAQHLAETQTGSSLDELAERYLFEPLAMSSTSYSVDPPIEVFARSTAGSSVGNALPEGYRRHPEAAAAGLWSSATDLALLLLGMQLALLDPEAELAAPAAASIAPTSTTEDLIVGSGWFLDRDQDPGWFWHNGRNIGFAAEVVASTDGRHGAVILTNSLQGPELIDQILRTIATYEGWPDPPR